MKKNRIVFHFLLSVGVYSLFSLIVFLSMVSSSSDKLAALSNAFGLYWLPKAIISITGVAAAAYFLKPPLDIAAAAIGDGQHGDARTMNQEEVAETYSRVPFGKETEPGLLVGVEGKYWIVDTSDQNMMLLAPPGAYKTTGVIIPAVHYNGLVNHNTHGNGASMLLMDIKGTLYHETAADLQKHGYRTPVLNLRDVFKSYRYNIMYKVNDAIERYTTATDDKYKAIYYGEAERRAKIVANSIIGSTGRHNSESSEYFNESAMGLLTGFILLVAEYATKDARNIMSVFSLILELSEQDAGGLATGIQITKLQAMLRGVDNRRIKAYVGATTSADTRTTLNIFSSAISKLTKFIDAEIEQLICTNGTELDAENFITQPTALYIICPDENPTRHFLASLFIRSFTDDLIELAETKYSGKLPRQFINFLDEFGNIPAIAYVDTIFSAIRSRGGRILCALQSYSQLQNSYSREVADIIRDTCQMLMFSFVAPSAENTAMTISKMLGDETVQSGSETKSKGGITTTIQMVGRALFSAAQLVRLPKEQFIVIKGSNRPYKGKLQGHWKYLQLEKTLQIPVPEQEYTQIKIASSRYIGISASGNMAQLTKGMFNNEND